MSLPSMKLMFDKAKYWENRNSGIRGQGEVPPLPEPEPRVRDENGQYVSEGDPRYEALKANPPTSFHTHQRIRKDPRRSIYNTNKDAERNDGLSNHERIAKRKEANARV